MFNVHKEMSNLIWSYYMNRVDMVDDDEFLTASNEQLKEFLTINYLNLNDVVIKSAQKQGKTNQEIKYATIKLNRTITKMKNAGVIEGEFNVVYKGKDEYFKEFPCFDKQDFAIEPTLKTLNALRVKIMENNINKYNEFAKSNGKKEIKTLQGLRNFLISGLKIDERRATALERLYGSTHTEQHVWNVKDK